MHGDRVRLMGLPIDTFTPAGLIEHLVSEARAGHGGYVMTPNLNNLRNLTRSADLFERAMAADVRVPDGMPLIWASRIQGTPLPARVPGSDVIFTLSDAIAEAERTVFLLGGNPGTADRAAEILCRRAPGLEVVGTYCPPLGFEHQAKELARLRDALCQAKPDFVYIGLPFEKASALALQVRLLLPSTWLIGLGISFSFVCGDVPRAPQWMQRVGLEWLYRLIQEPRRLFRRYVLEGFPFVARLLVSALLERRSLAHARREDPTTRIADGAD
jgi:N-acetylglucosaminyldiphosphoundecaprenol N-acetyl-beta-D-mannosaminyltransferase